MLRNLGMTLLLTIASSTAFAGTDPMATPKGQDWVFADLGETVVTTDANNQDSFIPGVLDNLRALKAKGFKLGLITNIPEKWGQNCNERYNTLRDFMAKHLKDHATFPWELFDAVVMPEADRYRKPHPFMFIAALSQVCPSRGRALFIGENAQERFTAVALGMPASVDGYGLPYFPTPDEAENILRDYKFSAPANCNFTATFRATLLPEDQAAGVPACVVHPR